MNILTLLLVVTPPLWLPPLWATHPHPPAASHSSSGHHHHGAVLVASALECGSRLARPCISEYDRRYDKSASNSLADQDPLWEATSGLWVLDRQFVDGDGRPLGPGFNDGSPASVMRPYGQRYRFFWNWTTDGSRYYDHRIGFWPPAPQAFCDLPAPAEGSTNVSGSGGACGANGLPFVVEQFGTSSYEKDGTVNYFWRNVGPAYAGPAVPGSKAYTVGDQTIHSHRSVPGSYVFGETVVLTSMDRMGGSSIQSQKRDVDVENRFVVFNGTRIQDAKEWVRMIEQAKIDYSITDEDWSQVALPGGNSTCISLKGCPTSDQFCTMGNDPECSKSPYQEPPSSMKPGYIALFTLLGVTFLGGIGYYLHRRQIQRQEKRYKRMFVRQVAQRLGGVAGSVSQLPPEALLAEFKRIDKGLRKSSRHMNGYISRDELWEFLSSGKAGEITESDFNALFDAMDLKKRGKVNFVEFCAFMSTCGDEFREVSINESELRDGSALKHSAQRLSVLKQDDGSQGGP